VVNDAAELAGPAAVVGDQVGPGGGQAIAWLEPEAGQAALDLAEVVDPGHRLLARVAALVQVDVGAEQPRLLGQHVVGQLEAGPGQAVLDPDRLPALGRGPLHPGPLQAGGGRRGARPDQVDPDRGAVGHQVGPGDPGPAGARDREAGRGQGGVGAPAEQGRGPPGRPADPHVVAEHEPGQPLGQARGGLGLGVEQGPLVQDGQPEGELDPALGRQQQGLGGVAGGQVEGVLGGDGVEVAQHVVPGQVQGGQVGPVDEGDGAGQGVHGPMVAIVVCAPDRAMANWAYTRREVVQLSEPVRTREVTAR
jgi:hypothetical protein